MEQLPAPLLVHIATAKERITSFTDFNINEIAKASEQPLKVLSLAAFLHLKLDEKLTVDLVRLSAFAEAIEGLYRSAHIPRRR
jgi:hypothetical protein